MTRHFDALIIGAGQAGPALAAKLADAGMQVAIVERKLVGGTCVNTGCTPTKAMVASAQAAHLARRAAEYGVSAGPVTVDMKAVKVRKDRISRDSRTGLETWLEGMERCRLYRGHARFETAHGVRVGDEPLTADRIFINAGGRALVPDLPGVDQVPFLTNSSILDLDVLPPHLAIVGGSYVGLEFAQMFRRFGSEVTIVEKAARLIAREDPDVSDAVRGILEREGIAIRLDAECIAFRPEGEQIAVGVQCATGAPEVLASHALLAVGRRPNTEDLGLDKAGVETDGRGYIVVDDQLRTSVPGIWALGDCNGRGAFTHTAYDDHEIVAANLLGGGPRGVGDRIAAYALYVDPPLARVGMTETEVRATGKPALVGIRPMTRVARAVEKGETQGFMKILVDAESRAILGAALLGVGCDEAVHGILDMMHAKVPCTVLRRAVHIHPTVSELIPTVLRELKPLA